MTRRLVACAVVAACVLMGIGFGSEAVGATTTPKTALIYGDSLTLEAKPVIVAKFAPKTSWRVRVQAIPGVALCEYTASLTADLAQYHPAVVTVETHGGDLDPISGCYPDGMVRDSPEYYEYYRGQLAAIFTVVRATGAKMVFFATPPDKSAASQLEQTTLTAIAYEEAAKVPGTSIAYGGRNALGGKTWRASLKCLVAEVGLLDCVGGRIPVRAPDTVHFCPAGYPDFFSFFAGCTLYSSGALRYGKALAAATVVPPKPVTAAT